MVNNNYQLYPQTPGVHRAQGFRKTVCENYKTKSTRKTAPEEQYIFDGEIPAIVDEETWNTVQRLMGTKRRAPKRQNTPNRLTGLLYCADCGAKLTHRSSLVQGKYLDDAFVCSSYRQLTRDCTMHYIPTAKMEAAILAAIQRVSWYVRHNEAEFIERVRKATDQHQENAVKEYRQKVSKAQRRYKELDGLVKSCTRETPQARYPISTLPVCLPNMTRNRPGWKPLSHNGRKQSRAGTPTG